MQVRQKGFCITLSMANLTSKKHCLITIRLKHYFFVKFPIQMSTVDNILDIWFEYPAFNLKKENNRSVLLSLERTANSRKLRILGNSLVFSICLLKTHPYVSFVWNPSEQQNSKVVSQYVRILIFIFIDSLTFEKCIHISLKISKNPFSFIGLKGL